MSTSRRKLSDITGQDGKGLTPAEKKRCLRISEGNSDVQTKQSSSTEGSEDTTVRPAEDSETGKGKERSSSMVKSDVTLSTNKAKQDGPVTDGNITADDIGQDLLSSHPWLGKVAARLTKFLAYANEDEQYYALLRIPPCLVWEKKVDGSITACNTLHTPLSSKPVMVWIVGQVTKRWFFDKNGDAYNQAAIHVRPLTASSFAAARLLMRRLGAPAGTIDDASGELRASCFRSRQVRGVRASETAAFDDVYDARVEFKSKTGRNGMTPLDAADIQDNDIVLVEATVIRYDKSYSKKDGKSGGKKPGNPDWAFLFQLHHISLLFTPTDKPDIEDERGFSGSL